MEALPSGRTEVKIQRCKAGKSKAKTSDAMSYQQFISCDWGTSNFRLRLVGAENLAVIAECSAPTGIAMINNEWQEKHSNNYSRESFYLRFLAGLLKAWNDYDQDPSVSVVISGMATSNIGIRSLEYSQLPFPTNGSTANASWIEGGNILDQPLLLISGLRSEDDVMRGEETQVAGLAGLMDLVNDQKYLFILPGTHSKHICVHEGSITSFRTYMTGELFSLISEHSIIKNSISKPAQVKGGNMDAFRKGVRAAIGHPMLHSVFTVRTNQLFERMSSHENYQYLSGLLIGAELSAADLTGLNLVLAGEGNLLSLYKEALDELKLTARLTVVPAELFANPLVAGQYEIFKTHSRHDELPGSTP